MGGRRKAPFPKLAAEDALAALRWLHATGELTAKQIAGALRKREEFVDEKWWRETDRRAGSRDRSRGCVRTTTGHCAWSAWPRRRT